MKYDVAVIGAGPAGATAAKFLSEGGLRVVLVEKERLPRDKPCGGALSLRLFRRFKYLKENFEDSVECPSYGVRVYSPSLKTVTGYNSREPQVIMVLRRKFDRMLAKMAIDSGVKLRRGRAEDVAFTPDDAKISLDGGEVIRSEVVVGSDGTYSMVGRRAGLNPVWSKWQVAVCAVNEARVGRRMVGRYFGPERAIHVFLFNDLFGHGWLFPKEEHLNVGFGGLLAKTRNIPDVFARLVRTMKDVGVIPKDLKINGFKTCLLPVAGLARRTYGDRVVLCGDAAGSPYPLTGEGVYYAMSSGEIASRAVLKAMEGGDLSSSGLSGYHKALMDDFGYDHEIALNVQRGAMYDWPLIESAVELAKADRYLLSTAADLGLGRIPVTQFLLESGMRLPFSGLRYLSARWYGLV